MRKKKVLLVASEYAPGMIPFAATVINTLAQDDRFDVRCLCVNSGKKSYRNLISDKAKPTHIEYPSSKPVKLVYKLWPFSIIKGMKRMCKEYSPDVVHFLTGEFTLALFVAFNKNDNFFYTVHDLHPHESETDSWFGAMLNKYKAWGYRKCSDTIDNLTTSSQSQLLELKQMYKDKWCAFTNFPTLVTPSIQSGNAVPKELVNENDYILFFGGVNTYKGVDLLIEAFEKSRLFASTKLVIAGKGLDYEIQSKNIIRMNRFIEDEEVAMLFRKAKLVVYPYISATMSGVLSLAYYFNKLVLSSDVQFFKDNATSSVTFFRNGDVRDLQMKLEDMIFNAGSYDVDTCSYERLYSTKALADGYWNLYDKVSK